MDLARFYKTVHKKSRCRFREAICTACDWSYSTFYYKMRHKNISRLEHMAISPIIEAYILNY